MVKYSSKTPPKSWIGKTLEVKKDSIFGIISGSSAYSLNLFKGQRLKVIGTQSGNWLQCKLLSEARFKQEVGIQMSEFEIRWDKAYGKRSYKKGIVIGVSLNFDRDKFKVVKK